MAAVLRLLIVDDSKVDAELLLHTVRGAGYETSHEVVATPEAMRAALESRDWDVITSDHAMPQFSAPDALEVAAQMRPDIPVIVVSGEIDLDLAVSLMKAGARDYVPKTKLPRLVPALQRILREREIRDKRQRAEQTLQVSERRYRRLFEAARDGILILDAEIGQIVDVNPFLVEMLGYSKQELLRKKLWEIGSFYDVIAWKLVFAELQDKGYIQYEQLPLETRERKQVTVECVCNVYLVDDRKVIQCNIRDANKRQQLEGQSRERGAVGNKRSTLRRTSSVAT